MREFFYEVDPERGFFQQMLRRPRASIGAAAAARNKPLPPAGPPLSLARTAASAANAAVMLGALVSGILGGMAVMTLLQVRSC